MPKLNRKEENNTFSVLIIIAFAVILLVMLYSCSVRGFFLRQAYSYVRQNAQSVRNQIDSKITHGIANIRLTSFAISKGSEENKFTVYEEPEVLDSFLDKTPFTFLQYVSPDGRISVNLSYDYKERMISSSQSGYYEEGLKGNSGLYTDFAPQGEKGVLLDFYSPVYLSGRNNGVLVGGISAEKIIKPLLSSDFYGKKTIGILCDSDFKVISSNYPEFSYSSNLNDLEDCPAVDVVIEDIKSGDESGFEFKYDGGEYIGCVVKLNSADWFAVQILPKSAVAELNEKSIFFILFIILIFCVMIIFYVMQTLKCRNSLEKMHVNIISALCMSYQNVYVVNIKSGKVFIYQLTGRIRLNYGEKFASGNYDENFKLYEKNEVFKDDLPLFDKVNEIGKIRAILKNQSEYSFIYRVKSGTTGGKIHFYQCYFIKPESSDEFVVTFKNVDDLIEAKEKINSLMKAQTTQLQIMSSISGIYRTMYLVDLEKNLIVEFNTTKESKKYIFRNDRAGEQIQNALLAILRKDFIEAGLEFADFETLPNRLKDKKYISIELNSFSAGWLRASFITVDADEYGFPKKVLFATQEINNEKRREEILISNAYTDELTNLLNRRAYEDEIKKIENDEKKGSLKDDFAYISLDLNGLKNANDTLGHAAGDELLKGAAACIKNAFGSIGKIFRTGGDEFQTVLFAGAAQLERAKKDFENDLENWSGKLCSALSVSYGVVTKKENPKRSVEAIIKLADKRMYRAKSEYYSHKDRDQRGACGAMESLCQVYTKILKVDLTRDIFSVIQMEESEKDFVDEADGIASKLIHDFGKSDLIEDSSREEFLRKTDFGYLKDFFSNGGDVLALCYGRKIRGEFQKVRLEVIKSQEYAAKNAVVYFFVRPAEDNK